MLKMHQKTPWGRVAAIGMRDGERYYMMVKAGVVSLIPEGDTEVTDMVATDNQSQDKPLKPAYSPTEDN